MIEPRLLTLQDLFSDRVHYEVPIYQRPYVWGADDQWEPLWEDVGGTARRRLLSENNAQAHFLGAIVIELTSAEPGRVKTYSVIDGQQRLTTLQVLLAALRTVASDLAPDRVADLDRLLRNEGRHVAGALRFKVWPSEHDRPALQSTIESPPDSAATEGIPGAFSFFRDRIAIWLTDDNEPRDTDSRFDALQDTLDGLIQVVAIQLDGTSDAQVVFETLNSRGADLTSLDLVKNTLLQQARRDGADIAQLHEDYWQPALGDADYWLETERQGRYTSPRADLFLMHWLTMKTSKPPRVPRLFADFRRDILRAEPPPRAEDLIVELGADALVYRSFDELDESTVEGQFFRRLDLMDTTTLIPVALLLFRAPELAEENRHRALRALESWLVRRMICGATTQHYNRLLAALLLTLSKDDDLAHADDVAIAELRSFTNPTDHWPDDAEILSRLTEEPLYGYINQRRIRMLLEACEHLIAANSRTEQIPIPDKLTVEHALPQTWRPNWPIPPLSEADAELAEVERDKRVHRLGNLTLVTQALNSTLSHSAWSTKRAELRKRSRLLVNQRLCDNETWDERKIDARGDDLASYIVQTWPGPSSPAWISGS